MLYYIMVIVSIISYHIIFRLGGRAEGRCPRHTHYDVI